ncbi:NADH-quinone oxidoreductase subunit C [Thiomicrospira sp. WB1]|uniref:NADH-quinone oxidoreductase subunit C n=1 Tax=Thiomicrospira sp. WB1 TaxID=1685380 RepID=UPI000748FEF7|nr:NADH-quinone oxidoreductase subunit C [Thiomicrospira sp. WB1]KUJ71836.1 NADH-quinone oxidoreductase subunit C [Thiomicrospira sp. WB1]
MKQSVLDLQTQLQQLFPEWISSVSIQFDELTLEVEAGVAHDLMLGLKNQAGFDQLIDLCGVDYLSYGQANWETTAVTQTGFSRGVFDFEEPEDDTDQNMLRRFAVVYHLLSVAHNRRVRVKVYADDASAPTVDSVMDVWHCADWFEREAFDLYGIVFAGHPDLRRILTDYGFVGHPLRKDFPLTGHVEMRYDPEKARVVYQPVTIENRINVPRVIRHETAQKQSG